MKNIRNRYRFILIIFLFAGIFQACDDLDENTEGLIAADSFYADDVSLKAGIMGVYRDFSTVWYRTGFSILTTGDDILTTRAGSNKQPYRDYDQFMQTGSQEWEYGELWNPMYKAIRTANTYIESVDNSRDDIEADETLINQRLAEAQFMRANIFFAMAKLWGDVPYFEDTSVKDSTTRRLDKRVIYDRVILDLEYAEQYCVKEPEAAGQVTIWAVKAALAKVYMQLTGWPYNETDKWQQVRQYTQEVISSGEFELMPNYGDLFKYTKFSENKENIFSFTYGLDATGAWQRFYGRPWMRWNDMHCQWKFYNDFPEGARKDFSLQAHMNVDPYINFIHPCVSKFQFGTLEYDPSGKNDQEYADGYQHSWHTNNNIALDRLADMYLLWAEADANITGSISPQALEYVNKIKRRAKGDIDEVGGNFYDTPMTEVDIAAEDFASTQDFIDEIFAERGWEFAAEWGYRWFDLIRLQKLGDVTASRDNFDLDAAIQLSLDDWMINNPSATHAEIDAQIESMKLQASELPLMDNSPTAEKYGFAPLPQVAVQTDPGLSQTPLTEFEK